MSLRIVVDMNLSVEWIPLLELAGWSAVHWSAIGDPRAEDATIMAWALTNRHVVGEIACNLLCAAGLNRQPESAAGR